MRDILIRWLCASTRGRLVRASTTLGACVKGRVKFLAIRRSTLPHRRTVDFARPWFAEPRALYFLLFFLFFSFFFFSCLDTNTLIDNQKSRICGKLKSNSARSWRSENCKRLRTKSEKFLKTHRNR